MASILDLNHLAIIGGHHDPELREIIDDFVTELSVHLKHATALIDDKASPPGEIRELAHKIRGMAGSLGFHPLAQLAAEQDHDKPVGSASEWLGRLREQIGLAITAWDELKNPGQV